MTSKKMVQFLPQIIWTGISISYSSGLMTTIITLPVSHLPESALFKISMDTMVFFGIGALIGTIGVGQVVDRFGNKPAIFINFMLIALTTYVAIACIVTNEISYEASLLAFFWGMQDSTVSTHCYQIISSEFNDSLEGYSVYNLVQSFVVLIFQLL
jgi:predicted MFS family arabinose efflux permease